MRAKPKSCEGCSLFTLGTGFVPDTLAKHPKIVLWAEAPGKNEVAEGKPMVGQAGFVLHSWLLAAVPQLKLAWDKGEVSIANTLRCLPPEVHGRAYPTGKDRESAEQHCRQYDSMPDTVHTVILFGEYAQRLFFKAELEAEDASDKRLGHDLKGVSGRLGRVYEREGKRWVFAPHPAWVLRQPSLVQAGQEVLKIAAGTDKLAQVAYVPWTQAMEKL